MMKRTTTACELQSQQKEQEQEQEHKNQYNNTMIAMMTAHQ